MKGWIAPVLLLAAAGCRGPQQFSAPAPAGSVACAVRRAEQMGYRRIDGRDEDGVVRVGRYIPPAPTRDPRDPMNPSRNVTTFESQLRITERNGNLRVAILAASRGGEIDPGGAEGAARQILAECSTHAGTP
jgi:hypothetical protein